MYLRRKATIFIFDNYLKEEIIVMMKMDNMNDE